MFRHIQDYFKRILNASSQKPFEKPEVSDNHLVKELGSILHPLARKDLVDFFTELDASSHTWGSKFIDRMIGPERARFIALNEPQYEDIANGKYSYVDDPKALDTDTIFDGVKVTVNINDRYKRRSDFPLLALPPTARATLSWEFTKYDGVFKAYLVGSYRDENGDDCKIMGYVSSPNTLASVRRGVINEILKNVRPVYVVIPHNNIICPFNGVKDNRLVVEDHYCQAKHMGPFVLNGGGTVLSIHAKGPKAHLTAYLFNGEKEQPYCFTDFDTGDSVVSFSNAAPTILPAYAKGHMVGTFEGNEWYFPETDFDTIPKNQSASYVNFIETIIRTGTLAQKEDPDWYAGA